MENRRKIADRCAGIIAKHYYSVPNKVDFLDLVNDVLEIYNIVQESEQ